MDISEEAVKRIEAEVVERARWMTKHYPGLAWVTCLNKAAEELASPEWDWEVAEFIGTSHENAHFFLKQYNG